MFVDSPDELVGKEVNFVFKIVNCRGLPNKYTDVHCRYQVYLDDTESQTEKLSLTANPDFNHVKLFKFNPGTRQVKFHYHVWLRKITEQSKKVSLKLYVKKVRFLDIC